MPYMSSEPPEGSVRARTRRKHHKVATGCPNCKRRRVKCDEAPDGCHRCQRANLFCPGYNPPRPRIFESSRSETSVSESDVQSIVQTQNSSPFPLTTDRGIDLRFVWQTALLDSFLTTWLPNSLVRDYTSGREAEILVPMSAWPLVAWKLAKKKDESFVAHALLCLTLCVVGSQTGDTRLVGEAANHYARVLNQFQAQVRILATSGYSAKLDEHVASLAAAGFCCSQIEYILQNWSNGDRHLEGMASLLEACGPACLSHDDTRTIFYDHYLLWTSCSITHRRPFIYSQQKWQDSDWCDLPKANRDLISTAARIAPLLEEYDNACWTSTNDTAIEPVLQRLVDIVVDVEGLNKTEPFFTQQQQQTPPDPHDRFPTADFTFHQPLSTIARETNDSFCDVVLSGYSSAFVSHAGVAAWEIIRARGGPASAYPTPAGRAQLTDDHLREGCERHLATICKSIDELANDRFGMITVSPLLFLLDSAWMGYRALQGFCGYEIGDVVPWFERVADFVKSTGYRPLREPWSMVDLGGFDVGLGEHDGGSV